MDNAKILRGLRASGRRRLAALLRPHSRQVSPAVLASIVDLDVLGMDRLWRSCAADHYPIEPSPPDLAG